MATDLWLAQPQMYMREALDMGARKFTWHLADALNKNIDVLSWFRSAAIGYPNVRVMIIDHSGAAEFDVYSTYNKPLAVYPTWAPDEPFEQLIWMVEHNVGMDREFTDDKDVSAEMRPVYGQKHRVVVHRIGEAGPDRVALLTRIRDLQLLHPECEIFISGQLPYSMMFSMDWQAVDSMPKNVTPQGSTFKTICLPTGKKLDEDYAYDPRYQDWFRLLGWTQDMLVDRFDFTRFNIASIQWAAKNFDKAVPFVKADYRRGHEPYKPHEFRKVADTDFVLPVARRILMRNVGFKPDEFDKFTCDTCMLHNACSLYREGSVCGVKGSEGMELSKHFGTRNAQNIISGLDALLKKQVERVENRIAEEETAGEMDPEVTKEINSVMANGTKLAKLLDPTLAGGPKVQVNVGVGRGGQAAVQVGNADPKQLVASIVGELEQSGIPREQITSGMIKGVLEGMAQRDPQQALEAAKVINGTAS